MPKLNKLFLIGFSLVLFFAFAPSILANTCLWNGHTSTAWNTAANWTNCGSGEEARSVDIC